MTTALELAAAAGGALLAGGINAVAGGGTLVSFPVLVALGVPPLHANVTSTIALCPGHFGGVHAQRTLLTGQRCRAARMLPSAALGGLAGSILLVSTSESLFESVVPWLIVTACLLLGLQDRIRAAAFAHRATQHREAPIGLTVGVFVGAIYGGYFGAGLGIVLLAMMGILLDDDLPKLNALKSVLAGTINTIAAVFLSFTGTAEWWFVGVMAPASLVGGHLGGRLATRMRPAVLRAVVITLGVTVAVKLLLD